MKKCEVKEKCNRKVRYTIIDHKLKTKINLCEKHFNKGMKSWFITEEIIKVLTNQGLI